MDTDSLSFRYEEHFSVFEPDNYLNDEPECYDNAFGTSNCDTDVWEWEIERELNGDVALIPTSSDVAMNFLSHSPPKEDFQKIMHEWQNFMNIEVPDMDTLTADMPLTVEGENIIPTENSLPIETLMEDSTDSYKQVDITPKLKFPRSIGKKIDLKAQCYIIDQKEPTEGDLEKIKAVSPHHHIPKRKTEQTDFDLNTKNKEQNDMLNIKSSPISDSNDSENDFIDVDTVPENSVPILEAKDVNSLLEQFEATETASYCKPSNKNKQKIIQVASQVLSPTDEESEVNETVPSTSSTNQSVQEVSQTESDKNKQILNALPQELILKIKASSKRKVIPVIDPIPNKRRGVKKSQPEAQIALPAPEKTEKVNAELIQREHDYCCLLTPYPKYPQKDSGFESAEEEEQRNILRNQPTVKGADGKLMVSLLKVNTIRNNTAADTKMKRKLNLEEYKKRREGLIRSCDNSQSNSPDTSGRSSPTVYEDDQTRLLKHQQKLMQMAAEVLNTPPKSARKLEMPLIEVQFKTEKVDKDHAATPPPPTPSLPENYEMKTLVSIGINTGSNPMVLKQFETCITELEEIKPILKNANGKISNNSLITSVIENIQNKKEKQCVLLTSIEEVGKQLNGQGEHGEDKTIVFLDKNRPPVITNTIAVQTDIPEGISNHRRRCSSRSSPESHRKSYKWRSSSDDSSNSCGSQSSSPASSYRSRSPSPQLWKVYNKNKYGCVEEERMREVEERRIVYVGGIGSRMTKEGLRRRFNKFGPISNISLHFREYGDNYGFVTFAYKDDAYEAVEHANDDPAMPQYDLSFGGRRIFCGATYSDLDNVHDDINNQSSHMEDSFDNLLREAQAKLRKRKLCQ